MTEKRELDLLTKIKKAKRKHRFNSKKFKDKPMSWRRKEKFIKPVIKICSKCKKRVVKYHHHLCPICWQELHNHSGTKTPFSQNDNCQDGESSNTSQQQSLTSPDSSSKETK